MCLLTHKILNFFLKLANLLFIVLFFLDVLFLKLPDIILKMFLNHLLNFLVVSRRITELLFDDLREVVWPKILTKQLPENFCAHYFRFLCCSASLP